MKAQLTIYALAAALCAVATPATFGQTKIAANTPASNSAVAPAAAVTVMIATSQLPDHSTFALTLDTAGLSETLQGRGPFTVFAPSNTAFEQMSTGLYSFMMQEEDKGTLQKMMAYHVVQAKLDAAKILKDIKSGRGKATYRTLSGAWLTFSKDENGRVIITDDTGAVANIGAYDMKHSNGLIHEIDRVLIPQEFN